MRFGGTIAPSGALMIPSTCPGCRYIHLKIVGPGIQEMASPGNFWPLRRVIDIKQALGRRARGCEIVGGHV